MTIQTASVATGQVSGPGPSPRTYTYSARPFPPLDLAYRSHGFPLQLPYHEHGHEPTGTMMEMCQQREFEDADRKDRKRISVAVGARSNRR